MSIAWGVVGSLIENRESVSLGGGVIGGTDLDNTSSRFSAHEF